MSFNPLMWIAIASAIAAWLAALSAYNSYRIAKRSLRLAEQQAIQHQPSLSPYLLQGYLRFVDKEQFRIYAFSLSVSNHSNSGNSIAQLELRLTYTRAELPGLRLLLPHDPTLSQSFGGGELKPFLIPQRIDAHQTVAGWAFYRLDNGLIGDSIIDTYTIIITDSHGLNSTLEPIIVCEFAYEEALAKSKNNSSKQS